MKIRKTTGAPSDTIRSRKHSQAYNVWRRLCRNKLAMVGLVMVAFIVLSSVFAPLLTRYDYAEQDILNRLQLPSWDHILGTDNFGRDLWARCLYGGRVSLLTSLLACAIGTITGVLLGAVSGYFSGWVDNLIMRIIDVIQAIPSMLLAVAVSAMLGTGIVNTAIALSFGASAGTARMMRATVLQLRDQEYVEASRACGARDLRTMLTEIVPNCLAPIIVSTTMMIGMGILNISALSFIGLGIQPPTPEWGSIMNSGREYIRAFYPIVTFPGIFIMITMFGFNVLGDGLRDALDPRLKQ